jgi:hypothetical protein
MANALSCWGKCNRVPAQAGQTDSNALVNALVELLRCSVPEADNHGVGNLFGVEHSASAGGATDNSDAVLVAAFEVEYVFPLVHPQGDCPGTPGVEAQQRGNLWRAGACL